MDQRKGIYQLLEAYRALSRESQDLRLLIVGGGGEVENVRSYIAENGLEEVVMLGPFDRVDAPRYFATADIFCSPALYGESFGLVLTEAMSCGKPVVAAANLGYSTVMGGEGAKFLVRPGDVGDLIAKLRLLISDSDLRKQMGAWGRKEAAKYDCRQVVPEIVKIYEADPREMTARIAQAPSRR